ncbi:hypothetical protein B296_00040799 [Ensete ventricosum]|uniref:Uncharacterized protein n=1 Tax=Ensete ventricosum TaxID=4639 RepID=A0A426ZP77_ENSVE|nr:hypothetical protein B296_00040799 [Ensete ventricosum]
MKQTKSFSWTKVKDMKSCKSKSGIMSAPHSDGADSSCMMPKSKGASRHMHLISVKQLTEGLRYRSLALMKGVLIVMKGAEEVENAEANSKYHDKA